MNEQAYSEHAKFYNKNEYLIIKDFIPSALLSPVKDFLEEELKLKIEPIFKKWGISVFDSDCAKNIQELLKRDDIPEEVKFIFHGHFPQETRLTKNIYPLIEYLGKKELLKNILKSKELYLHMPPMMRYVPPHYFHAGVPPHQDIAYNTHLGSSFLTIWLPLVPIDMECGGVILYEQSQSVRLDLEKTQRTGWLPPIDIEKFPEKRVVGVSLGDAVMFSPYLIHASAPNISNRFRFSLDLRIIGNREETTKHCINMESFELIKPSAA